ncbi:unnamed protein product [Ilex paraguariensis]|uniref:Mon2/Sec7/BIG1-like dimerisation and cyclophilin-binding domain-containing protein n=1 Tax=Ilex paraguariensis TaxID=185542 RepID=A0ABC8SVG7_9AQUA
MAGRAAGGFVTRALESMLKECSGKKYTILQSAIQSYLDSSKEINQHPNSTETNQAVSSAGDQSNLPETDIGDGKSGSDPDTSPTVPFSAGEAEHTGRSMGTSGTITTALANAGHTLEGAEAELVLNPLRLAFETKNLKVIELALDCLHKLIAYDHLEGDPGLDGGKNGILFTDILNMICSCVDNSSPDSTTLQVLKVLLTAVASLKFRGSKPRRSESPRSLHQICILYSFSRSAIRDRPSDPLQIIGEKFAIKRKKMAGRAAGGFVTRALESMLKECSGKKYTILQSAIQSYLDSSKEINQHPNSTETNQAVSSAGDQSNLPETDIGDGKSGSDPDTSPTVPFSAGEAEHTGRSMGTSGTITTALANAGHTLEGAEAELVLNPLRLAFETKNLKVIELALDCLHKLIAYDHLEGDPGLDGGKNGILFTDILNMICSCVDNSSPDSTTLQVLKVLLTAVASLKFRGMSQ